MKPMTEAERLLDQIQKFNRTDRAYSTDITVVTWLEAAVVASPDRPAIFVSDQVYSYDDLNRDANRLAHALIERNIGSGSIVALMLQRSYSMMVCIYGILKAGAAYLPLDPECPSARLVKIMEDSSTTLVVTEHKRPDLALEQLNIEMVSLFNLNLDKFPDWNLEMRRQSHDVAYLIYTSGSTGDPKGVLVEHGALINRMEWMQRNFSLTASDVLFQKTVYTFDVSVWELVWWTMMGAPVVLLPSGKENDPRMFVKLIEKRGISVIHFVPSVLRLFLEYIESDFDIVRLASLRYVFCSGEALPASLIRQFYSVFSYNHSIQLVNLYGPTEATIDVSSYICDREHAQQPVPIGKPIDNIRFYILRKDGSLAGIGEVGLLHISGIGLARGYLNNPQLTHTKFVHNLYESGQRMYCTGDLAYWNEQGEVIYVGREDHQIKLRGLRIELREIENCLLQCEKVKDAIVGVHINETGDQILTAYVVMGIDDESEPDLRTLQMDLARDLPTYAVPTKIICVNEIPLKSNGKVDRSALFSINKDTVLD